MIASTLLDLPPVPPEGALRPLIKFSGGKRWLVPFVRTGIRQRLAAHDGARYIEPFAGGLAVGIWIGWPRTIAGDLAPGLIELYRAVQRAPGDVIAACGEVACDYPAGDFYNAPALGYYGARREWNASRPNGRIAPRRAALLLYMIARGYNGLYRVNARGAWNVPEGRYASGQPIVFDPAQLAEILAAWSRVTAPWEFRCGDFAATIGEAGRGDVIFGDPPYADIGTAQKTRMFTGYTPGGFAPADQARLADALAAARDRGVVVLHTNADAPEVRALYDARGFWTLPTAELRAVNRDGGGRRRKPCLIVTSHPEVIGTPEEESAGTVGALDRSEQMTFGRKWA